MGDVIWTGYTTFTAPAGQETLVEVSAPHMGELRGAVLTQTSGGSGGFAAKLYTSAQAAAPNSALPASSFLVVDLSAGNAEVANRELQIAYKNRDGDPSNHQHALYLRITPQASGDFVLTLTVGTPAYL